MTRLEELSLNLADDNLGDQEALELQTLLAQNDDARATHIRILDLEAGLRASRRDPDLVAAIMAQLHTQGTESVVQGVMSEIKARPMPDRGRDRVSNRIDARFGSIGLPFPVPSRGKAWSLKPALFAIAACGVLVVGFGVWCFGPTVGKPVLAEIQGTGLSLERGGRLLHAEKNTQLEPGDILRTSESATALISYAPEKTGIRLATNTELAFARSSHGKRLTLLAGKLEASVARQRPFNPMLITTPQAKVKVLGTSFMLTAATNITRLDVVEGNVRLTRSGDGASVKVPALHYALVANATELSALPQTGGILREWWSGVSAKSVPDLRDNLRLQGPSDGRDIAPAFELEPVRTNHLGVRFRGYLHPPTTGDYEFWLAGAHDAMLSISPGEGRADKGIIATTPGYGTGTRAWDTPHKNGSSRSAPMPLVAGRKYYMEGLIYIDEGEGHLSVAWKRPGASRELLTGEFLSPDKPK